MPPRRRRRVVQPQQQLIQGLSPQASPVESFQRPDVRPPPEARIYDLAALSAGIRDFIAVKQQEQADRSAQDGRRFVAENPEIVSQIEAEGAKLKTPEERDAYLRKAFRKLHKQGVITQAADPYWQIGYARAAGRQMVQRYEQSLRERMSEAAATRDENGDPTIPPPAEAIAAEEWARIAHSPAIENFYGGQVALAEKERIDDEFRTKVGMARAEAMERDFEETITEQIGVKFDQVLASSETVTGETLRPITDFVTAELHDHNVKDPRKLVLQALELSFQRAAAVDPDEAVRGVIAAQDLVIGDTRLGDDRTGIGGRLEELKRRYRDQSSENESRALAKEDNRRKRLIQEAEGEFIPTLVKAKQDGIELTRIADQLAERYLEEDPQDGAFKAQAVKDFAQGLDRDRQSDQTLMSQFQVLLSDGKLEDADALLRAGLETGDVTGEDYAAGSGLLADRRSTSPFVEDSGLYRATASRYQRLRPTGYPESIQTRIDEREDARLRRMTDDFVEFVRSTAGQPNREDLHRRWLSERETKDAAEARAEQDKVAEGRAALETRIRSAHERFQDADAEITEGLRSGLLTESEARDWRDRNTKASSRDQFYRTPEYAQAEAGIERVVASIDLPGDDVDTVLVAERARTAFRDKFDAIMDGVLADQNVKPRDFQRRSQAAIRQAQNEVLDEMFPDARKVVDRPPPGRPAAEVIEEGKRLLLDRDQARQWADSLLTNPDTRENFSASSPFLPRHPLVDESFYKDAALWMSGLDPWFGAPVDHERMRASTGRALSRIAGRTDLREGDRNEALGTILRVSGASPEEVLSGSMTFALSEADAEEARRSLETYRFWLSGILPDEDRKKYEAAVTGLEQSLKAPSVDIAGVDWAPHTTPFFRDEQELERWTEDARWPEFLRTIGINAADESEVDDFVTSQLDAIARTNP